MKGKPKTYRAALKSPYYREQFRKFEIAAREEGLVGLLAGEHFSIGGVDFHAWALYYRANPKKLPEFVKPRRISA